MHSTIWLIYLSLTAATCSSAFMDFHPQQARSFSRYNVRSWVDLDPRQSSSIAITGIPNSTSGDGSVPLRQEIRQLQSNADQWNLYLLGLDRLQTVPAQADELSHYSISGIHGLPFVPWDGVQATAGDENSGYCTHQSVLFPTWHRPYLALYEQVLYSTIQTIVNEFSNSVDRDRYGVAASTFRIPYWDWAAAPPAGQSILPDAVTAESITVNTPNGKATIDNPLFAYKFHPNSNGLSSWSIWNTTLRCPTDFTSSAVSQNAACAQVLDNNRLSLRNRLYILFTAYSNYANFSNEAWYPNDGGSYDSLESVHDVIHGSVGGGGHMSYIPVAAFDPIFYLHHTMVDRAFAIWQALNGDSYVEPTASKLGTFTTTPGTLENVDTGLTPFHSDATGDLWTSVSVRSTEVFGYSYPELPFWTEASDPAAYQASIRSKVNTLYGSTAPSTVTKRSPANSAFAPVFKRQSTNGPTTRNTPQNVTIDGNKYREWLANLRVQKFALAGTFSVYLFLGDFTSDPAQWAFDSNLVGTQCIFTGTADCEKGRTICSVQVTGSIPLTTALLAAIENGYLPSLQPDDVEPYLTKNLHWRVALLDKTAVQPDQVPGLLVSVASAEVTKAGSDSEFPVWGPFTVHRNITDSRPGGLPIGGIS